MWKNDFSMEAKISAEEIWKIWTDVENWKDWVGSIEYSKIEGKFENGTFITTKAVNGLKSKFWLKDVVENKSFTIQTKLPLCTMCFTHELENNNNGLKITLGIKINGILTFVFKNIIGKSVSTGLPISVKKLIEMVS